MPYGEDLSYQNFGQALTSDAKSGFMGGVSGAFIGGLTGGVDAELSGGDFWRGAGAGATVALLNHFEHQIEGDLQEKRDFKKRRILNGVSTTDRIFGQIF